MFFFACFVSLYLCKRYLLLARVLPFRRGGKAIVVHCEFFGFKNISDKDV